MAQIKQIIVDTYENSEYDSDTDNELAYKFPVVELKDEDSN